MQHIPAFQQLPGKVPVGVDPAGPVRTAGVAASVLTSLLAGVLLAAAPAAAQISVGPQLSWGSDSDLGAGVRTFIPLPPLHPFIITAGANYFFGDERPDSDLTWIDVTGGLVLPLGLDTPWEGDAYAGGAAGLSFISETPDPDSGSDRDVFPGLHLLAGWRADTRNFSSFVEVRGVFGGASQVVLTAGLLFGGGR